MMHFRSCLAAIALTAFFFAPKIFAQTANTNDTLQEYTNSYQNSAVKAKGKMREGKMQGVWTRWYPNGKIESVGSWIDDVPEGHWTFWYSNGQKNAEGEMRHGQRLGEWTFWDTDGTKHEEFLTASWENLWNLKTVRVDFDYITQNSSGSISTVGVSWSPLWQWKKDWSWRGIVGAIPIKTSTGSIFTAIDIEVLCVYGPFSPAQLSIEAGGGIDNWSATGSSFGVFTANMSTQALEKYKVGQPFVGFSSASYPAGDQTTELRVGTYFSF